MKSINNHDRKSIRLQGYNYSHPGLYFITACTYQKLFLFGEVNNGKMILNTSGKVVHDYWNKIELRFPNTKTHQFITMPNHIHGIIEITNEEPFVGAIHESPLRNHIDPAHYRNYRRKMLVPKIIGWFKMNVAKQINIINQTPGMKVWQRNYYDHIVRNEESFYRIQEYIINNPRNWNKDRFFTDSPS